MALLTLFMGVGLKWPQILTLYMLGLKGLLLTFLKRYDTCMYLNYGCGVKMAPDINPINAGLERSCPKDSKSVM